MPLYIFQSSSLISEIVKMYVELPSDAPVNVKQIYSASRKQNQKRNH